MTRRGLLTIPGAVLLLVVLAGCATPYRDGRFENDHVGYTLGDPGEGWRQLRLPQANVAWYNDQLGAALLVNSHCEAVKDAPLEALTTDLLIGTTEREFLEQKRMPFAGREALETVAAVKLDGVPRRMGLFVLKKDGCVYDVVIDAPPERFEEAIASFRRVRDGLDVGPRRDRG